MTNNPTLPSDEQSELRAAIYSLIELNGDTMTSGWIADQIMPLIHDYVQRQVEVRTERIQQVWTEKLMVRGYLTAQQKDEIVGRLALTEPKHKDNQ